MNFWRFVYWLSLAGFLLAAALNLLHVRAGFPTSYLADVTVPGLVPGKRLFLFAPVARAIGRTPVRAAMFFFLASTATEFSQLLWPHGFFAGRFDPLESSPMAPALRSATGSMRAKRER